jgi:lactoylglutathione lyase
MTAPLECRFHHVHVFCSDYEATVRWFVERIGAELLERREARGVPQSELRLGGAHILIRGARKGENLAPAGVRQFGTDHFGLQVPNVDAAVAELRQRGVSIEVEPWDVGPNLRIAFVKGPDDVRIELVQIHQSASAYSPPRDQA